ncbi:MAG: hypothetical protein PVJ49_12560, partial [Acidobacteriota bacterium]
TDPAAIVADVAAAALGVTVSSGGNGGSLTVAVTVAENTINNTTEALVMGGSTINAAGAFDAHASSTGSIDALGVAASVSVGVSSGGSAALSGAGAGVGATNTITNTIEAGVIGGSFVDAGGAASISATDSASVISDVATAAVAVAAGSSSVTLSLVAAVSVATNTIDNTVQAHVLDSSLHAVGALDITATSNKDIDALGLAIAVSVSASSGNFNISGAFGAAIATNTIGGQVEAQIAGANATPLPSVQAGGPITLFADNVSTIDAILATAAVSISVGSGTVNLSLAGAVSITTNSITSVTLAAIDNSEVDSGGAVSIRATAGNTINANTVAFAASVAAGSGTVTLAGGFAVASATNSIGGSTQALIRGGSTVDAAGSVGVTVNDTSTINSNVIAAAVAVAASSGSVAGSLALAVSLAQNTIEGAGRASINASEVNATGGDVIVSTLADNAINAIAAAAAISVAASSSVGVAISGAGAWAKNVMTNDVEASIMNGSTVIADGSVSVTAVDSSSITARLVSVSVSVAVGSSAAVAVGFSLALTENEIGSSVLATIDDSEVTAQSGGVTVLANDGGVLNLTDNPWADGDNALVIDGDRRFVDLRTPDQPVDLKVADPWSSGTNALGGVALDGDVAVNTVTDAIAIGTVVNLTGENWSSGSHSLETNTGAKVELVTGGVDATVTLNPGADTLTFVEEHGFTEGDFAFYRTDDASASPDLESAFEEGVRYRVIVIDEHTIKLQSGHTFNDGDTVMYTSDLGGSDNSGLVDGANYIVVVEDEFNIKLKPEAPVWASGTNTLGGVTLDEDVVDVDANGDTLTFGYVVNLTDGDWNTGTKSLTRASGVEVDLGAVTLIAATNELDFGSETHDFDDGEILTYSSSLEGADASGLIDGQRYRVEVVDEHKIKLQTGHSFTDGEHVDYSTTLPADGSGLIDGAKYQVQVVDEFSIKLKDVAVLDGSTIVNIVDDTITFASAHYFETGDILAYSSTLGGADDSGLSDGGRYRATVIDSHTIQLTDSRIIDSLAVAAAVSVAVSGGGVAVGVSVAGAVALNTIEGGFEASIVDSDVDATGSVQVAAQDSSAILAMLFAVAVSVSASGGGAAVGVAASVALAHNTIEGDTLATIDSSTVDSTAGSITVEALSDASIHALAISAAIAAGGGTGVSVQVAVAGVLGFNTLGGSVEASIVGSRDADPGDGVGVFAADDITVLARNESHILAALGAVSIAAGGSGTASINVSVAATFAQNTIGGSLLASIDDSTVESSGGAVTVEALADNLIEAFGIAVGVSAGGSGGLSINVALSAVAATNTIVNAVEASIKGGSLVTANDVADGAVTVHAQDVSDIFALLLSASIAAGGAGATSVNVAGAFVYASNALTAITDFDWNNDGDIDFRDLQAGVAILTALRDLQAGEDGAIGPQLTGTLPGPDGIVGNQPGDDGILGTEDDVLTGADDVRYYVNDDLTVEQAIDAYIRQQAAGLSETKALQLGPDGVVGPQPGPDGIIDSIDEQPGPYTAGPDGILGGPGPDGIFGDQPGPDGILGDQPGPDGELGTADDIPTGADDVPTGADDVPVGDDDVPVGLDDVPSDDLTLDEAIDAYLAANPGFLAYLKTMLQPLVGSSFDINEDGSIDTRDLLLTSETVDDVVVGNSILATIDGSTVDTEGAVTVTASNYDDVADDSSGITAIGIAVGIAAGGAGGVSVNVSGAGVIAFNEVSSGIEASIVGSTVDAGGDVTVEAEDRAEILSLLLAISISAGGAGGTSVNVSVSFTYGQNTMGGSLLATVDSSTVETSDGEIVVDASADSQIQAIGVAVGVSAGGAAGGSVNVAVAGVVATNTTTNSVEASIRNGSIVGDGDPEASNATNDAVTVSATDVSDISAILVSAAVSAGGAAGASVNVSVAFVYASNSIGGSLEATIDGSTVDTTGAITVTASTVDGSDQMSISSFGIAVGVSAGGAAGASINVTGAGVLAFNQIVNSIEASIVSSTVDAADDVLVAAEDGAAILSQLLAITVAAGGAGAVSVNVAVSATYAENTMGGSLLASIDASNVESTGGMVTVDAYADNSILALGQSVGVAAGGAGGVSINVALSAVAATNISGNTVEASIKNGSEVDAADATHGAVTVSAKDVSGILAALVSVSVAAGGAGAVSVNAAGALVYASNAMSSSIDFDWNADGVIDFYDIHAGVAVLTRLNELRAGEDRIFEDMAEAGADEMMDTADDTSTADDNLTADQAIDALSGLDVFASGQPDAAYRAALKAKIGSTFDINGDGNIDFRDLLLTGTTSDDVRVGNALLATIGDSQVDTAGAVNVSASTYDAATADQMEIESFGIAVGIAAGGAGGVSVNVAGAGVIAFNQINNAIEASIIGSRDVIAGDDVTVEATNKAKILSVLGAFSVGAGGAGALSVNVSVSITYADNTLGGSLLATIDDSKVESTGGDVIVKADAENTLQSFGLSVGVAAGGAGGVSINLAVSAVIAGNTLSNDVEASIVNGSDVDGDAVSISALDSSTVASTLTAVSVAVGGAGGVSLNLSLALSIAEVNFGTSTQAIISGSAVTADTGDVTLTALSDGSVDSLGVAVGVAFGAAGGVSGNATAAGAVASLNSTNLVEASIAAGSDVDATAGSVLLSATDETAFTNEVFGIAVGGGFAAGTSITLVVAYAEATSSLGGTVRARISDSDVDAGTNVELTALADSSMVANGTGVAVSMSAALGFSLSGAGAGAVVLNTIFQTVQADILASNMDDGQDVTAVGSVLLSATDSISSTADASAASISISGGFVAGGIAVSAAVATNFLAGLTAAGIDGSRVRANTGALTVAANSESQLFATPDAYAVSVAIGLGAAGAGA